MIIIFIYWHIYPPFTRKRWSTVQARLRIAGYLSTTLKLGGIPLSAFPNGSTSVLTGLLQTVPYMLNIKQGSCEYQFLSHWFDPTQNRTPSLPIQKQTLYLTGLSDRLGRTVTDLALFRLWKKRSVRFTTLCAWCATLYVTVALFTVAVRVKSLVQLLCIRLPIW